MTVMRKTLLATLVSLLVAGCMVGPDYVRPPVDAPTAWRLTEPDAKHLANTAWWEQFGDPVLNDLVATALRENKDLMIATARIDEFAGKYGFVRSGLFPQVGAGYEVSRQRNSAVPGTGRPRDLQQLQRSFERWLGNRYLGSHPSPDRGGECATARQRGRPQRRRPVIGRQRGGRLHQPAQSGPPAGDRQGDGEESRRVVRVVQAAFRRRGHLAARAEPEQVAVRRGAGQHPAAGKGGRPAGERPERAAWPQPRTDRRAARTSTS